MSLDINFMLAIVSQNEIDLNEVKNKIASYVDFKHKDKFFDNISNKCVMSNINDIDKFKKSAPIRAEIYLNMDFYCTYQYLELNGIFYDQLNKAFGEENSNNQMLGVTQFFIHYLEEKSQEILGISKKESEWVYFVDDEERFNVFIKEIKQLYDLASIIYFEAKVPIIPAVAINY